MSICKRCNNISLQTIDVIDVYQFNNEFSPIYTKWIYHDEEDITVTPPVNVDDVHEVGGMYDVLQDILDEDAGDQDVDPNLEYKADAMDDLFEELEAELWPECTDNLFEYKADVCKDFAVRNFRETGKLQSLVDNYEAQYKTNDGQWTNKVACSAYEKIIQQ